MRCFAHGTRGRVALLAVALFVVVAGCGGSSQVERSGSPATVADDALVETDYEAVGVTNRTLNATLTVTLQGDIEGRESVDVAATIPVATYRRGGDAPTVVTVAASPAIEVIENPRRVRDPVGSLSPVERVGFLQDAYDVSDLSEAGTETVTVFGSEATLRTFEGTATRDGEPVDVTVLALAVRHDDDVVHVVAVAPAGTEVGLDRLLEGLRH